MLTIIVKCCYEIFILSAKCFSDFFHLLVVLRLTL